MKKILFVTAILLAFAFFAGCGRTGHGEGDSQTAALVGEWDYEGSLYYTFNSDGTGRMFLLGNIRWATDGGILSVCITPGLCGSVSNCSGPQSWAYSLSGNVMTLVGQGVGPVNGGTFEYLRR